MSALNTTSERDWVAYSRITVGFIQGLLLFVTMNELDAGKPATGFSEQDWRHLVDVLRTLAWFAPLPLLFGLGNLPTLRLAMWSAAAVGLLALFGWLGPAPVWDQAASVITVWLFSLIVIFIIHEFVQSAHDDRKTIAQYTTYFDNAWRHGFQVVLALIFLAAFWVVISLGAWLFNLIGLEVVRETIFSDEFRWISSGAAFALGLHITDAGSVLTRGARQLGLALLSWLSLLMTLILTLFLIALPFTGLEPLWDTKRATVLLLNAGATMILLINAAFQAGDPPASRIMRTVVRFSAVPLLGVVFLAAIGLWLRVDQYGLTPARVLAGVQLFIIMFYAIGYLVAALRTGPWMGLVKPVNIAGALVVAALLSLLMTPVLDPARVSVDNQVARLLNGDVEPDDFDFSFLANARSRHWGDRALEKLAARSGSERDDRIALYAQNPRRQEQHRSYVEQTLSDRRDAIRLIGAGVIPEEAFLPLEGEDPIESCLNSRRQFLEREARRSERQSRKAKQTADTAAPSSTVIEAVDVAPATHIGQHCLARLVDIDFDGDADLLIWDRHQYGYHALTGSIKTLVQGGSGEWTFGGTVTPAMVRDNTGRIIELNGMTQEKRQAFLMTAFQEAQILPPAVKDLAFDDFHIQLRRRANALNAQEIRARVSLEPGVELPELLLTQWPNTSLISSCRPVEDEGRFGDECYGRVLDITGGPEEEFVLLRVKAGSSVAAQAYERQNGAWRYIGGGTFSLDDSDLELVTNSEQLRLIETLRAVEPRLGDLEFAGTRYVFAYPEQQNRRR